MTIKNFTLLVLMSIGTFAFAEGLADLPDGAAIKLLSDGGFKLTAIGTGTYDFDDPDDVLDAQKEGTLKAKAALAKFMKEDLATEEGLAEASKKVKTVTTDGETDTTKVDKVSVKESLTSIHNSANALLKGVITLAAQKVAANGTKGTVRVQVGVSSKTLAAVRKVDGTVSGDAPEVAAAVEDSAMLEAADKSAVNEASGVSACPDGWIECKGSGNSRFAAVQAALAEGISMVYGEKLSSDTRLKERSAKLKANFSFLGQNKDVAARMSSKEVQTDTMTSTAGFVKSYRIIKVVEKGGVQEVTVHAFIVNPRAGGAVALLVKKPTMSVQDRTAVYTIGNKKMSGKQVANEIQFAMPKGLASSNKFLVLTEGSIAATAGNQALTQAMVSSGMASASELNEVGQGLTPDYALDAELKDIKFTSKLGKVPGQKKLSKIRKLTMTLDVSLTDVRKGQVAKSDKIVLTLGNDEIEDLLAVDEDADLLTATIAKLGKPLLELISK